MRLLLKSNTFEYDSNLYTQATGVSIGGTFACAYSGVFMGEVEEEGLRRWYGRDDVGQEGSRLRGTGWRVRVRARWTGGHISGMTVWACSEEKGQILTLSWPK